MPVELQSQASEPVAAQEGQWLPWLRIVLGHRLLVAAVTGLVLLGGLSFAQLTPPVFRSDALLQIEERKKGIAGLEDLNAMIPTDNAADPEIEILRSRSIAFDVMKTVPLDVLAEPRRFPVFGGALARAYRDSGLAAAPLGLSRFAWGGESIAVDRLEVPPALEDQRLVLTARGDGGFLLSSDGEALLEGSAGKAAEGREVSIFVSRLTARPGTEFVLRKLPVAEAIARFKKALAVAELGRKTGILRLELSGEDPARIAATLDALANAYLRQNVERKSEEAERTLEFVNAQLPELKQKLEAAEEALNTYRSRNGRVDVPLETKAAIDRSVEIEKTAAELRMQRVELRQKFTSSNPVVVAVERKISQVDAQRSAMDARIKGLPAAELNSMRLLRDVKLSNELYVLLLNKAQELRMVKSGTIGNVRILDRPLIAGVPAEPRKGQIAAISLVLGLFLGVLAAFGRNALGQGVEDPDVLEAATGLRVYVSIPHSPLAARGPGRAGPLATRDPTGLATEAFRSLRTSLHFALLDAKAPIVAIVGPSPGGGKSFVAANLAQVLADSGKRVLLVDGDMRNGSQHAIFGFARKGGLSELIAGTVTDEQAIHDAGPGLDVLTAGVVPPNPSELVLSARFRSWLEAVASRYDLVVLDTPPALAVTDSALIARLAGVTLLVLRSGKHPLREVMLALKQLALGGVRVAGIVFNDVPSSKPHAYGYHYQYEYRSRKAS